MCEIAKKYFIQGQNKARFDIFRALVVEDGLSIEEALVKARVPEEDCEWYIEMVHDLS